MLRRAFWCALALPILAVAACSSKSPSGGDAADAGSGGASTAAGGKSGGTSGGGSGAGGTGTGGATGNGGVAEFDATPPVDGSQPVDAAPVTCSGTTTADVTRQGSVSATSTNGDVAGFDVGEAIDGDPTTCWFTDSSVSTPDFTWTDPHDDCITRIQTTNSAKNVLWPNWGFNAVTVEVQNSKGTAVFTKAFPTLDHPNQDLDVDTGGVVGRSVVLEFSGFEPMHTTGGFAEINVTAKR